MKKLTFLPSLFFSLALALSLAGTMLVLTGCSDGSSDDAPATEAKTEATTEDAAQDEDATAESEEPEATDSATPETAEEAGYLDSHGNLTLRAIDELGSMREDYGFDFIYDVLHRDEQNYCFDEDKKIWWHDHGWLAIYDKDGETPGDPIYYDMFQSNAELENADEPIIATIAVSKEDYSDAKAAYEAIAEGSMGGEERSEFTSDGSWGKGVIWGNDVYVVLVGDGGDAWRVDVLPNNALGQGLLAKIAGLPYLTYTEAYTEVPEGTVF